MNQKQSVEVAEESHQAFGSFDSKQRSSIMRINIFFIVVLLQKVDSNRAFQLSYAAIVK